MPFHIGIIFEEGQRLRPRLVEINVNFQAIPSGAIHEVAQTVEPRFTSSAHPFKHRGRDQILQQRIDPDAVGVLMTKLSQIPVRKRSDELLAKHVGQQREIGGNVARAERRLIGFARGREEWPAALRHAPLQFDQAAEQSQFRAGSQSDPVGLNE